jgi:hypothetical protein
VYRHFHGSIPVGLTINHINGNKLDNRPSNLETATFKQQRYHATHVIKTWHPQYGEDAPGAVLTNAQVRAIRRQLMRGITGVSLAEKYGVSTGLISMIRTGKRWATIK